MSANNTSPPCSPPTSPPLLPPLPPNCSAKVHAFFRHNRAILAAFLAENPAYWHKQQNRIRSYWHCYHRYQYPDWPSYPINRLAQEINGEVKQHRRLASGSLS